MSRREILGKSTAIAACWWFCVAAYALPMAPGVVQGSVNFQLVGPVLNITVLSPSVVINWGSFSVGAGETVRINSLEGRGVLNRVVGVDPSLVLGNILTPANFGLINQSGILSSSPSHLQTGDVLLSTVNILNQDFVLQAGDFTGFAYQWTGTEGPLILDGLVDATGHTMYLAAPTVTCSTCSLLADTIFIDTMPARAPVPGSLVLLVAGLMAMPVARRFNRRPAQA